MVSRISAAFPLMADSGWPIANALQMPLTTPQPRALPILDRLEAESVHILREVGAEVERPVMLYSIGKDIAVMLHLEKKAFYPAKPPLPLLHVDTTWKICDTYAMRARVAAQTQFDGAKKQEGYF